MFVMSSLDFPVNFGGIIQVACVESHFWGFIVKAKMLIIRPNYIKPNGDVLSENIEVPSHTKNLYFLILKYRK